MTTRARLFLVYIPLAILLLQIVIIILSWLQPEKQPEAANSNPPAGIVHE